MGLVKGENVEVGAFEGLGDDDEAGQVLEGTSERVTNEPATKTGKAAKVQEAAQPVEAQEAVEAPAETTSVAKAEEVKAALVPISKLQLNTGLASLKDSFAAGGISIDFGTFPRVKIEAGIICSDGDLEAGSFLDLEVMSFSDSYIITPSDDAAPTSLARYSTDGKVIESKDEWNGRPCTDYVVYLKQEGYEKAEIREYMNLYGAVVNSDKPFYADEIVCVQCSPQARARWTRHMMNHARRVALGKVEEANTLPTVRVSVEKGKAGTKAYYFFTFSQVPQA